MPKKILIVDDEPQIVEVMRRLLSAANFDVVTAVGGREGYRMALEHKPDVILLDIVMPDMDGTEVSALLRQEPDLRKVPIVFFTGLLKPGELKQDQQIGGHYYLEKPVRSEELLALLKRLLEKE